MNGDLPGAITNISAQKIGVSTNYGTVALSLLDHNYIIASNMREPPPHTVERTTKITEIAELLDQNGTAPISTLLASGTGGQGKSILTRIYAHLYRARYPKGCIFLDCEQKTLVEVLHGLVPFEIARDLSLEERAKVVRDLLCREPGYLVVLDNIDTASQWNDYINETVGGQRLLPTAPCHVIITSRHQLPGITIVEVDRLTDEEFIDILAKFNGTASLEDNRHVIHILIRETEGLAFLAAAIGAAMEDRTDWQGYAEWLASRPVDSMPEDPTYPKGANSVITDLLSRISSQQMRALQYACLLPSESISYSWIEWLLRYQIPESADLNKVNGPSLKPIEVIQSLVRKGILIESDDIHGETRLSCHRLLQKFILEHLEKDGELGGNLRMAIFMLVSDHLLSLSEDAREKGLLDKAVKICSEAIDILKTLIAKNVGSILALCSSRLLSSALDSQGRVKLSLGDTLGSIADHQESIQIKESIINLSAQMGSITPDELTELASYYLDLGNTQQARGETDAAQSSFTVTQKILEELQKTCPVNTWPTNLQSDLAATYMNKGNAYRDSGDIDSAISAQSQSVRIRTRIRNRLEPEGSWDRKLQAGLGRSHMNRGISFHMRQQFDDALKDFEIAEALLAGIQPDFKTEGNWALTIADDLAKVYIERASILEPTDHRGALVDLGKAINIYERIRVFLSEQKSSNVHFSNTLAVCYSNRGSFISRIDPQQSLKDLNIAGQIFLEIESVLEESGSTLHIFYRAFGTMLIARGRAYEKCREWELARQDYQRSIDVVEAFRFRSGNISPQLQAILSKAILRRISVTRKVQKLSQ